ncbi:MAG TPA: 5'/3'-nucleotidase SurE [Ilumatobacteraceae bacterium]|nr:5'/3'-nucleotidase SurE [Ilumatobacteraceae bacterium]
MRILVTNDDGIDSIGLHVLARAICGLEGDHEVVVIAPDQEYSGAGAAIGALHLIQPEVRRADIADCPADGIWKVSGPPALCVFFARLGAFGGSFDLVVSGINPGANVGRAVYHSGTVGAALTGRNGHISGIAVSQAVTGFGVEGQGWDDAIATQHWDSAATVAAAVAQSLVDDMPVEPVVVNINVPDVPIEEFGTWRYARVGDRPPRSMSTATLKPIPGHQDAFTVEMGWGDTEQLDADTDGGIIERNDVAITYLTRLAHEHRDDLGSVAKALDGLLG